MKGWISRRVRFLKATSEKGAEVCRVSVELKRPDEAYVGRSERPCSADLDMSRAGAEAAAEAIVKASGVKDAQVTVEDIERVNMFGRDIIIVSVSATHRGQTFSLFGVSQLTDDPATSGALAVLSATNRVLELS